MGSSRMKMSDVELEGLHTNLSLQHQRSPASERGPRRSGSMDPLDPWKSRIVVEGEEAQWSTKQGRKKPTRIKSMDEDRADSIKRSNEYYRDKPFEELIKKESVAFAEDKVKESPDDFGLDKHYQYEGGRAQFDSLIKSIEKGLSKEGRKDFRDRLNKKRKELYESHMGRRYRNAGYFSSTKYPGDPSFEEYEESRLHGE